MGPLGARHGPLVAALFAVAISGQRLTGLHTVYKVSSGRQTWGLDTNASASEKQQHSSQLRLPSQGRDVTTPISELAQGFRGRGVQK